MFYKDEYEKREIHENLEEIYAEKAKRFRIAKEHIDDAIYAAINKTGDYNISEEDIADLFIFDGSVLETRHCKYPVELFSTTDYNCRTKWIIKPVSTYYANRKIAWDDVDIVEAFWHTQCRKAEANFNYAKNRFEKESINEYFPLFELAILGIPVGSRFCDEKYHFHFSHKTAGIIDSDIVYNHYPEITILSNGSSYYFAGGFRNTCFRDDEDPHYNRLFRIIKGKRTDYFYMKGVVDALQKPLNEEKGQVYTLTRKPEKK